MTKTKIVRRRLFVVPIMAGLAAGLGGCVSQQEYDKLWETVRSLRDHNNQLRGELEASQATIFTYESSSGGADQAITGLRNTNTQLRGQLSQANQAIERLEDELGRLEIGQLDPQTDRALRQLAASHPALIRYDSDRGMLQFASDLTFGSGSAIVQDGAKSSLSALAQVLKTSEASAYDIRVVGHTDSQRVSSGTAQRHPTNMHLSAHRAIAVRNELVSLGVPPAKIEAAGWGEFRPMVPNTASGNTPQNRRVEVFLVRASATGMPGVSTSSVPVDDAPPSTGSFEPTK